MNNLAWGIRQEINRLSRTLIADELFRKKLAVNLYNAEALKNKFLYRNRLKYVDIDIARPFYNTFITRELYRANAFYGTASVLKKYCAYSGKLHCCIEHGLYLGDYYNEKETVQSGLSGVVTYGPDRLNVLKHVVDRILPIGPYIQYATVDSEFYSELNRALYPGKTLLVFPMHSTDSVSTSFDLEVLISKIEQIKKRHDFTNVIINLYFRDITETSIQKYKQYGYVVTCCGHMNDPNFLNRQRALIERCDVVASNHFGTYIGYAIALNKPYWAIEQETHHQGRIKGDETALMLDGVVGIMRSIQSQFISQVQVPSDNQLRVAERYWGVGIRISKEKMRAFFLESERRQ